MNDQLEEKFDNIIVDAIAKAEAVKCPFDDFVAGLQTMYKTLQRRYWDAIAEQQELDRRSIE